MLAFRRNSLMFQHTAARRRLVSPTNGRTGGRKFQHTAARRRLEWAPTGAILVIDVSTHSRPKAAGYEQKNQHYRALVSTHSRPKAAGWGTFAPAGRGLFQHTAARRRLVFSTVTTILLICFNTQPPEGGWKQPAGCFFSAYQFQHTAARRRLVAV